MTDQDYKYDVAFSFLAEDEGLATEINNLIEGRLSTFIYSRRQDEIAGTNGEITFDRVFGSEARIVFVLYRKGWGETPWTRIEETAIRNRAFEEGYDFVMFAPLEKSPAVPKWLPKTRIWVGLEQWGVEGAAIAIESRVQEAGGSPREETLEERAARLSLEITKEKERKALLNSEKGVQVATQEINSLFAEYEKFTNNFSDKNATVKIQFQKVGNTIVVFSGGFSLELLWRCHFINTLEHSVLYLRIWKGRHDARGISVFPFEEPKILKEIEYNFDLNKAGEFGWKESVGKKHFYSSKQLIEKSIDMLFSKIRDEIIK